METRRLFIPVLAFLALHCVTSEDKPAPAAETIKIISPAAGATYKLSDTIRILTESDYTKFSGGIHISYSFDSSKTWQLIRSFGPKKAVARDTLRWFPFDEAADPVYPGLRALIKVTDYNKAIVAQSAYFEFTN